VATTAAAASTSNIAIYIRPFINKATTIKTTSKCRQLTIIIIMFNTNNNNNVVMLRNDEQ
jgi:hypothetical protein